MERSEAELCTARGSSEGAAKHHRWDKGVPGELSGDGAASGARRSTTGTTRKLGSPEGTSLGAAEHHRCDKGGARTARRLLIVLSRVEGYSQQ